jgi:hypothetical protein
MSLTAAQLAERSTGFGGSDAAAACGLSRWKSAYQLYLEKRGEAPLVEEENEAMRWGTLLEPVVRQGTRSGQDSCRLLPDLSTPNTGSRLPSHGITDDGRLYEGKATTISKGWGEPETARFRSTSLFQVSSMLVISKATGIDILFQTSSY